MFKLIRSLFGNKTPASSTRLDETPPDALPYKLVRVTSTQQFEELRTSAAPNQVVLVGNSHSIDNLSASLSSLPQTSEEILTQAAAFEVREWASPDAKAAVLDDLGTSVGEWPCHVSESVSDLHPSEAEKLLKHGAFAAILPCRDSWAAPAYLPVGDLDQCPSAQVHVALARKWSQQFGAEIVAITSYTTEFRLRTPPTDRDACEQLAWEHVLYAPECLGEQSIREYAHSLANSTKWLFLWD